MNNTNKSSKSGKKKKGKKKGSRAGSRASSRSSNNSSDGNNKERPDYEAEEIIINSKRKNNMELTNKSDLLKPVVEKKKKKPIPDNQNFHNDLDATADKHNLQNELAGLNHETKGFDTLMADDYNHNQPKLDGVKQASTKRPQKRNTAVVRPRRF